MYQRHNLHSFLTLGKGTPPLLPPAWYLTQAHTHHLPLSSHFVCIFPLPTSVGALPELMTSPSLHSHFTAGQRALRIVVAQASSTRLLMCKRSTSLQIQLKKKAALSSAAADLHFHISISYSQGWENIVLKESWRAYGNLRLLVTHFPNSFLLATVPKESNTAKKMVTSTLNQQMLRRASLM